MRQFTPVLANDTYDAVKGYGFTPGPAPRNDDRHWIASPLGRDSVRLTQEIGFRIRVAPGRYRLRVSVTPFGETGRMTLLGGVAVAGGGTPSLSFSKAASLVEADVIVGQEPVTVSVGDYADIQWLTLIEQGGN
jgi:hypothetical protein